MGSGNPLLPGILGALGKVKGPDRNGWYTALCPFHDDVRTPNLRFNEKGFKCFACNTSGSLLMLANRLGVNRLSVAPTGLSIAELSASKRVPEAFLQEQGVRKGVIGSGPDRRECVDIPYYNSAGELIAVRKRLALSGKDRFRWRKNDKPFLYGLWHLTQLESGDSVWLVEGESDCWALWHQGFSAVGVPGSSSWKDEYSDFLSSFEIFLWVEPDQGGQTLLKAVSATLPDARVITAPAGIKDPSELHLMDAEGFTTRIKQLSEAAQPASALAQDHVEAEASKLWTQVHDLANSSDLIRKLAGEITARGYAGDPRPVVLVYIAITSRLLDRPPNVIFIS